MFSQPGKARISALVSVVLCAVALILSFLCLFAGSSKGFMEDYAIITLNTSQIGQNVVSKVSNELCSLKRREITASGTKDAGSMITQAPTPATVKRGFIGSAESIVKSKADGAASAVRSAAHALESDASHLCDEIGDDVGDKLEEILQVIGLNDWYSAHVMDFCQGYYVPGPVVNGTCDTCVKPGTIHKNVTACSNTTVNNHFDPKGTLAEQLKQHTDGKIDLTSLHWPSEIDDGLNALKVAQKAVFVFYCIAITSIFLALMLAVIGVFHDGRLSALSNVLIDGLALFTILLASIIVTVIAVKATNIINKYGKDIDISATRGNKFIALTWATTGIVLLCQCIWSYEFFHSWRRERTVKGTKFG